MKSGGGNAGDHLNSEIEGEKSRLNQVAFKVMRANLMRGLEWTWIIPETQCVSFMPAVTMTTHVLIVALQAGKRPETEHVRKGKKLHMIKKLKQE